MNMEEIKVGDYVIYEDRRCCVNKINGDKALCRFFGYTKWLKIKDLVKTEKWKGLIGFMGSIGSIGLMGPMRKDEVEEGKWGDGK